MTTPTLQRKIRGTVIGTALADAWGIGTEFKTHKQNRQTPTPLPQKLIITDDTQMSLYNHYAYTQILNAEHANETSNPINIEEINTTTQLRDTVRKIYANTNILFYNDPDNNRAPGVTCMNAIKQYISTTPKITGQEGALSNNSKGCGANMRATWFGLYPHSTAAIITLAILQAQTTHNHPLGWASAAITALITKTLTEGHKPTGKGSLFLEAIRHTEETLTGENGFVAWDNKILSGLEELKHGLKVMHKKYREFKTVLPTDDPNKFFGEGWVAEEALYNAIAVVDKHYNEPMVGIESLVHSGGDSDSTAAIAGAFFGALLGDAWLPDDVMGRFEEKYTTALTEAVEDLLFYCSE